MVIVAKFMISNDLWTLLIGKATGDWFFYSSRLQLASGHLEAGTQVA